MAAAVHIGFLFFIIFFYSRIHVIISLTHHGDAVVLQALKNSWENTPASWNLSNDPCGFPWEGVRCSSDSRVIELIVIPTTTSLKGNLGGVIGDLTELKTLDLSFNKYLTGPLPPQLGNLSNLHSLLLMNCNFTGSIPDELGNITQLLELDLIGNMLSGEIPPSLGKLLKLVILDLSENQLSGKLPVATGKTPGLDLLLNAKELALGGNKLSGKIPPSLGKLSQLRYLDLSQNQLSGQLPVSSGKTPGLDLLLKAHYLRFDHNNLSGSIPSKLFSPNMSLTYLSLSGNQFKGKIPDSLGLVQTLEFVWMNNNALSGEIPSTISNLRHLQELDFAQNKLSGALPDLSKMASLYYLDLSNNSFAAAEAPTWFTTLHSLKFLKMEYGSFHGPVPTKLLSLPEIKIVNLRNNAFNGTLTINRAIISSNLSIVALQNNQISAVSIDFNSTNLLKLAGNPVCAKAPPNTSYCHQGHT